MTEREIAPKIEQLIENFNTAKSKFDETEKNITKGDKIAFWKLVDHRTKMKNSFIGINITYPSSLPLQMKEIGNTLREYCLRFQNYCEHKGFEKENNCGTCGKWLRTLI